MCTAVFVFFVVGLGIAGLIAAAAEEANKREDQKETTCAAVTTERAVPLSTWMHEREWSFDLDYTYSGPLQTGLGTWDARATYRNNAFQVQLHDPPQFCFAGWHGGCLSDRGQGWWEIHFPHPPQGIQEAVCAAEQFVLKQAKAAGVT